MYHFSEMEIKSSYENGAIVDELDRTISVFRNTYPPKYHPRLYTPTNVSARHPGDVAYYRSNETTPIRVPLQQSRQAQDSDQEEMSGWVASTPCCTSTKSQRRGSCALRRRQAWQAVPEDTFVPDKEVAPVERFQQVIRVLT